MNSIPPPPPGMLLSYGKHDGFERSSGHLRSKGFTVNKRKRTPIDERDWYLAVFINDEGDYEICSSSNITHVGEQALKIGAEALLQEKRECQERRVRGEPSRHSPVKTFRSHAVSTKARSRHSPVSASIASGVSMSCPVQDDRHPSYHNDGGQTYSHSATATSITTPLHRNSLIVPTPQTNPMSNTAGRETMVSRRMLEIRMCEREKWEEWFGNAFRAIQQQACRFIAKEWIKLIHPKKQSTHPYNGNFPRNCRVSPECTRPPYWPSDVKHKEPDHIDKGDRTKLLVWLLTHTPQQEITAARNQEGDTGGKELVARDMLDVLTKKKDEMKTKWEIICAVIDVRTKLENYEEGGCEPDDIMHVPDYQETVAPGSSVKRSRRRSRVKPKQEPVDSGGGSPSGILTAPGSPAGSTTTQVDFDDDDGEDNEDDKSAMDISFSSSMTRKSSKSSKSSAQIMPMALDNGFQSHLQVNSDHSLRPTMLDSQMPTGVVEMNTPIHIEPRQPMSHQSWPTSRATHGHLHVTFGEGTPTQPVIPMLDPIQYGQFVGPTHSNNPSALMMPMPYFDPQQFESGYEQHLDGNAAFRPVSNIGHAVNLGPDFALPDPYYRMYAPGAQAPSH